MTETYQLKHTGEQIDALLDKAGTAVQPTDIPADIATQRELSDLAQTTDERLSDLAQTTDAKLTELSGEIGAYRLDFDVVDGEYINNSTKIDIPLALGESFSILLVSDADFRAYNVQGLSADGQLTFIAKAIKANIKYTFVAEHDFVGIAIFSDKAAVGSDNASLFVKKNLSLEIANVSAQIEDVEHDMVSELDKRLFNEIAFSKGKYIISNGTLMDDSSNGYYSEKIAVNAGDKFSYSGAAYYNNTCIYVLFDKYGGVIGYDKTSGTYENRLIEVNDDKAYFIQFGSYITPPNVTRITEKESMQTYVDNKIKSAIGDFPEHAYTQRVYNFFDKAEIELGKYIQQGVLKDNNTCAVSGYINIEPGKTYTFPVYITFFGASNATIISLFDSDKNYIGYEVGELNDYFLTLTINKANAKYIRTTLAYFPNNRSSYKYGMDVDTYMVVEGTEYPRRYYPCGKIKQLMEAELPEKYYGLTNPLFGKVAIFDGDSICHATSADGIGWAGRIGMANNMMWQNFGISGGTFTGGFGNHCISETDYGITQPDYIIIEGGTNDADKIGSILNGAKPDKFGTLNLVGYDEEFSTNTYCGAIESLFKRLLTTYPNAKIGVIIAQKMGVSNNYTKEGNNRRAYFEVLMQLCEKWGIPYINLWDKGRLNPKLSVYYTNGSEGEYYTDGQHLTARGYDLISPMIEEWMRTL